MLSRHDNDPVAEYLARLRAVLEGLPANEREEAYRELAQHVESLVNAKAIAGGDEEATVRAALEKFGNPEEIGQKIVSDYWAQAFHQMQPKREHRRWLENNLSWLSGLIPVITLNLLIHFPSSPMAVVSLTITTGPILGVLSGWRQAQARKRIWEEGEAEAKRHGEPTAPRRKLPR